MIKISKLAFVMCVLYAVSHAAVNDNKNEINIKLQKYLERSPKVIDKKADWIFELKNKDKKGYFLTITNGGKTIAEELSVLPAKGSSDSDLGYVRINLASGFNPLHKDTFIELIDKNNKNDRRAWSIRAGQASDIFVSCEKGKLMPQRSGTLQKWYASNTTSGLPLKNNIKANALIEVNA